MQPAGVTGDLRSWGQPGLPPLPRQNRSGMPPAAPGVVTAWGRGRSQPVHVALSPASWPNPTSCLLRPEASGEGSEPSPSSRGGGPHVTPRGPAPHPPLSIEGETLAPAKGPYQRLEASGHIQSGDGPSMSHRRRSGLSARPVPRPVWPLPRVPTHTAAVESDSNQ